MVVSTPETPARSGRRAGPSTTRDDIRRAARELFASGGFDKTTMRAVATRAGVDVALVPYYFGNKRGLFLAAMELPIDPAELVAAAARGPREGLGLRLATGFLTTWDSPESGPALQGFLRSAVVDDYAARAFGEFTSRTMLPLIAAEAGISEDTARVLSSMLFGVATMRYVLAAPAFTRASTQEMIDVYGPRVQAVIDAD
ncbi:TetR family transcriptional regulator [Gordonia caeni]|uniref:TetR family transcriptional regulator n=1 Tax=Gordonia caeni TaxID=1007097 RepID=A0ABP7PAY3_9ACTN